MFSSKAREASQGVAFGAVNGFSIVAAIFITAFTAPALILVLHGMILNLATHYYGEDYAAMIVFALELLIYPAIFFLSRIGLASTIVLFAIGLIAKFV